MVGLGNPGPRYAGTRHNAGFLLAARVVGAAGFKPWKDMGECAQVREEGLDFFVVRPLTYMNESGRMVDGFARCHGAAPHEVLACFDDISLPLGRLRIRLKGSSGGQKGMRSILDHLGTQEVPRLRIGIGPLPPGADAADYVLRPFARAERAAVEAAIETAREAVFTAVREGVEAAMNKYNALPPSTARLPRGGRPAA